MNDPRIALVLRSDGSLTELAPANATDFKLAELQDVVGGNIEVVPLDDRLIMVVNEDGKGLMLPPNEMATIMAHAYRAIFENDVIAGTAVVCLTEMLK